MLKKNTGSRIRAHYRSPATSRCLRRYYVTSLATNLIRTTSDVSSVLRIFRDIVMSVFGATSIFGPIQDHFWMESPTSPFGKLFEISGVIKFFSSKFPRQIIKMLLILTRVRLVRVSSPAQLTRLTRLIDEFFLFLWLIEGNYSFLPGLKFTGKFKGFIAY